GQTAALQTLLHAVLHHDVGVGGAGGAAGGGGLYGNSERRAGGIVLRDSAAVVGGGCDRDVHRGGAVGEPDDGVGGAAARRGFCLHLQTRHGDLFVGRLCPA